MITKAKPGAPAENQHGALIIKTTLFPTHIAFDVNTGTGQIRELCKTFADRGQAAAYYRQVSQSAEAGTPIHRIVAEVQVLQEAQMVMDINATMDTARDSYTATLPAQKARNLGAYATPGRVNTRPAPRNTLSPRLLAQAFQAATPAGDIYIGPGVSERFLRAMANHGLGRLITGGTRRYQVVKLHLSPTGQALRNLHQKEVA